MGAGRADEGEGTAPLAGRTMRFGTRAEIPSAKPDDAAYQKRRLHLSMAVSEPENCGAVSQPVLKQPARLKLFEETTLPHLNAAYNLARWLTRNEHDAQDVVQESYLRAFRYFDSYKGGDGKSWLLAVVRNTHLTWRRQTKPGLEMVLDDESERDLPRDESSALNRLVEESRIGALRGCIEQLPVEYRGVLVMRELEEMSYQQISEAANLPIGTVMSRLSRARKRLAECVGARR
jgi:RNA polymerase sigma-70 factor, ECF subfamily